MHVMSKRVTPEVVLKVALVVLAVTTLIIANHLTTRAIETTRRAIHDHPELLDKDGSCGLCAWSERSARTQHRRLG